MELGHSLVQAPRGASASASRRRGSGVTASPSRKVNGNATVGYASPQQQQQQQQQQEQEQEQEQQQTVLGRKLECSKRPALPRSSSFELQNLGVPQQQYHQQPQTKETDVRSFSRRPSAAMSKNTPLYTSHLALGGVNSLRGGEGEDYENGGFYGWQFHKKSPPPQQQQQQKQQQQQQQQPEGGHLMGRPRPRPSSAQEPPTQAPLIRRSATAGNGLGDGRLSKSDPAQAAPMLPLLAPDDDAHERYHSRYNGDDPRLQRHQRHHTNRPPANGATDNLSAADTENGASAVAAAAATPPHRTACPSSTTASGTQTKPKSKSRTFSSKAAHHLHRETDLTYARPTRSSSQDNLKHGGRLIGAAPLAGAETENSIITGTAGGVGGGSKTAGGQKPVTPQSVGLDTEASARLIVGRSPPATSTTKPRSGEKLAIAHGHELSRQPSSRSVHELSAPRIAKRSSSPVAQESMGWPSCGGITPYDGGVASICGVIANSGITGNDRVADIDGIISNHGVTSSVGVTSNDNGCIRYKDIEKGAARIRDRGGSCASGEEKSGGERGEGLGARHNHGIIARFQNGDNEAATTVRGTATAIIPSRGDASGSSEYREGVHQRDGGAVSGNSHHLHQQQQQEQQQQQQQQQQRRQQQQQQRKSMRVEEGGHDVGENRGTLLPGPEGCVEVRELEEGVLVVRRTWHEKKQSPERLNLHRRQLKSCPLVQGDGRLRLLNYQNNLISKITNLANLPNLIFLDLYNNLIDTLEGPLSAMSALRVVMVGKNRIEKISNLDHLRKLDVLDLHSNAIQHMEGLSSLQDLRVLNLAGNCLRTVENVSCLPSLTELNLRRNSIEKVTELDALPTLQRLFLSNNKINTFQDCRCIFSVESLLELSLDGNPVAGQNCLGSSYRRHILQHLPGLHHLDLKRVTNHDQVFPLEAHDPTTNVNNLPARHPHTKSISLAALGSISPSTYSAHKNGNHSNSNNSNYEKQSSYGSGGGGLPVLPNTDSGMQQQYKRKEPGVSSAPSSSGYSYNWPPSKTSRQTTNKADTRRPKTSDTRPARPCPPSGNGGGPANHDHCPPRNSHQKAAFPDGASEQEFVSEVRVGQGEKHLHALKRAASKDNPGDGASVAPEERNGGVTAEPLKMGRGERERRALKERAEAIEAARECWENRMRRLNTSRARHRSGREGVSTSTVGGPHRTAHPASPPTLTPTFSPNKGRGRFNSSPGSPTPPLKPNCGSRDTASSVGSRSVKVDSGDRSRDRGGGGRGRVSRGVGYFELEQRFGKETVGSLGGASGSGAGIGPGITLKVYGDVWRWLGDPKVHSLKDQVVEARFSLVHAASVAKKAAAIAQTFKNLSCLRLLDNDLRSMKQLERLRPLLTSLRMLYLGNNPVTTNTSSDALRAWIKVLGPHISVMDLAPQQQEQQPQEQTQEEQELEQAQEQPRRGSPSSMLKRPQSSPAKTKNQSTLPLPYTAAASRPHFSLPNGSNNNINGCFKPDATENAEKRRTTTNAHEKAPPEEDPNGKQMVEGGHDTTTGVGGGVSSARLSSIGGGASTAAILLGTTGEDRLVAVERWPGCVNNNEYTIEAAGDVALRSGAGATAPSRSQTASTASARRTDCNLAEATPSVEATAINAASGSHDTSLSEGDASKDDILATCSERSLGGMPVSVDAAFARLVEARDRAVASAWGTIVLAGRGSSASGGGGAIFGGEMREARGGDASPWGASATAAKLACNIMARRVCETDRIYREFDLAWEAAVEDIVQDVLARNHNTTHTGGRPQGTPSYGSSSRHPENLRSRQDMATTMVPDKHIRREEVDRIKTHHPCARWLEDY